MRQSKVPGREHVGTTGNQHAGMVSGGYVGSVGEYVGMTSERAG